MSERLPQGSLVCGSQVFTATLLLDPLMSAFPFIEMQQSQRLDWSPADRVGGVQLEVASGLVSLLGGEGLGMFW